MAHIPPLEMEESLIALFINATKITEQIQNNLKYAFFA